MNLSAFASAALLLAPPSSLELVTNGQGFSTLHVANLLQPMLDVLKKQAGDTWHAASFSSSLKSEWSLFVAAHVLA